MTTPGLGDGADTAARRFHGARWAMWAHLAVALVFLAAGALKVGDPGAFAKEIANYRLVSPFVAGLAALYLPWLEISLGLGLVWPRLRAAARLLGLLLLGVFCAALVSTLARGLDIRCGCFGGGEESGVTAGWALLRNLVLLGLLAFPVRLGRAGR